MAEITLTSENFDTVTVTGQSETPVLVDFWATWCGPCRMLAPVLTALAEAHEGELTVGKVNVDEERELAIRFHIESIPTLLLFREGKQVQTLVGYRTQSELEQLLGLD